SGNLRELGICDEIVPEPSGGAHADWDETADRLRSVLVRTLEELQALDPGELVRRRQGKYEALGSWVDGDVSTADSGGVGAAVGD
ncbi:MAG TPA: hypothetical protein VE173_07080, partial [Longimicrobiales bacterium]|nr:hypothetical protein [Longimicrobiales bacterium]